MCVQIAQAAAVVCVCVCVISAKAACAVQGRLPPPLPPVNPLCQPPLPTPVCRLQFLSGAVFEHRDTPAKDELQISQVSTPSPSCVCVCVSVRYFSLHVCAASVFGHEITIFHCSIAFS